MNIIRKNSFYELVFKFTNISALKKTFCYLATTDVYEQIFTV